MIRRRDQLRFEPVQWHDVIGEIRASGYGTGEICWMLNCTRGALDAWEHRGSTPNYEHGRAVLALLAISRNKDTSRRI